MSIASFKTTTPAGLEPALTASETAVLPLYEGALVGIYIALPALLGGSIPRLPPSFCPPGSDKEYSGDTYLDSVTSFPQA